MKNFTCVARLHVSVSGDCDTRHISPGDCDTRHVSPVSPMSGDRDWQAIGDTHVTHVTYPIPIGDRDWGMGYRLYHLSVSVRRYVITAYRLAIRVICIADRLVDRRVRQARRGDTGERRYVSGIGYVSPVSPGLSRYTQSTYKSCDCDTRDVSFIAIHDLYVDCVSPVSPIHAINIQIVRL